MSSYPERCMLSLERRTLPGESPDDVEAEIEVILERFRHSSSPFQAVVKRGIYRPSLETPEDADIVQTLKNSAEKVIDKPCEIAGVSYWTDAATLSAAGIPSVLFGPAGTGAHAVIEWVDLQSVKDCAEIYLATALEFCGT